MVVVVFVLFVALYDAILWILCPLHSLALAVLVSALLHAYISFSVWFWNINTVVFFRFSPRPRRASLSSCCSRLFFSSLSYIRTLVIFRVRVCWFTSRSLPCPLAYIHTSQLLACFFMTSMSFVQKSKSVRRVWSNFFVYVVVGCLLTYSVSLARVVNVKWEFEYCVICLDCSLVSASVRESVCGLTSRCCQWDVRVSLLCLVMDVSSSKWVRSKKN